jgi:hypothetical protein
MAKSPDPMLPVLLDVLEGRRTITLVLADDLDGRYGLTDKVDGTIFLDRGNTLGEHRATLVHELLHLARPDLSDEKIEALAAEMLVPLASAMASVDVQAVADTLGVDPQLVRARLVAADMEATQVIEAVAG